MTHAKRVAIVQSNYVPWRGYFDLIGAVDEFILLDDAQYTRRDWRNRNRIKTPHGSRWLTIPVLVSGRYTQSISETLVAEPDWGQSHWEIIRQNYAGAHGFSESAPFIEDLYATVPGPSLTDVNRHFLDGITARLGIDTPLTRSSDYGPQGARTDRLVDLCLKAGATEYVSGPAAKAYLDEEAFERRGMSVTWFEYGPYPEHDQPYPPFDPQVSVLDVLLCTGRQAAGLIRPTDGAAR